MAAIYLDGDASFDLIMISIIIVSFINFKDFGLFLLNLDLSNKFLKGSGDLVLNVDNTTKRLNLENI